MNCNTKHRIKKELKLKKCRYCGSRENLTIDHKHPIILGGTNERKNLQCLCYDCNQLKADIPDKVFRKIMKFGAFLELQNKKYAGYNNVPKQRMPSKRYLLSARSRTR